MMPSDVSFKQAAWQGAQSPGDYQFFQTHIMPWLGGSVRQRNDIANAPEENYQVMDHLDKMVEFSPVFMGGTAYSAQILDVYDNAQYTDIEGFAPRIFLKDANASNAGLFNGELNNPWSGSNDQARTLPWLFDTSEEGINIHQNSTGIGFVIRAFGNDGYTAYGEGHAGKNPWLNACYNRPIFQQAGAVPITWKVTVRCCRIYHIEMADILANLSNLYDADQGQSCSVDVFLFGVDKQGRALTSDINEVYQPYTWAKGTGATTYFRRVSSVPFLFEGYGGDGDDFGSAVNILSNVTDGVAGGYTYGTSRPPAQVSAATHQAQYDQLYAQLSGSGWTEITFYAEFPADSDLEALQIRVDNNTNNSSLLVDYVSLVPLNISVGNLYANNAEAMLPIGGPFQDGVLQFNHSAYETKYNDWGVPFIRTGGKNAYGLTPSDISFGDNCIDD